MKFENFLIGSKLYDITDEAMTVIHPKFGLVQLELETYDGDCCGYAIVDTSLLIPVNNLENAPVITNVNFNREEDYYGAEYAEITLFGESKKIAEIQAECGSGSGWCYGAAVTICCRACPEIDDTICEW